MLPLSLQLIAIAHATVIDMTGAPPHRDFTVVADGARITAVGPSRYLGALDSLGTIERGKLADLVLLERDPTADIRNARRIAMVMTRGRVYDAKARQALFDSATGSVGAARPHALLVTQNTRTPSVQVSGLRRGP
jgi:cytosine/adenosine deaminase-related metal-dependent hydrolase